MPPSVDNEPVPETSPSAGRFFSGVVKGALKTMGWPSVSLDASDSVSAPLPRRKSLLQRARTSFTGSARSEHVFPTAALDPTEPAEDAMETVPVVESSARALISPVSARELPAKKVVKGHKKAAALTIQIPPRQELTEMWVDAMAGTDKESLPVPPIHELEALWAEHKQLQMAASKNTGATKKLTKKKTKVTDKKVLAKPSNPQGLNNGNDFENPRTAPLPPVNPHVFDHPAPFNPNPTMGPMLAVDPPTDAAVPQFGRYAGADMGESDDSTDDEDIKNHQLELLIRDMAAISTDNKRYRAKAAEIRKAAEALNMRSTRLREALRGESARRQRLETYLRQWRRTDRDWSYNAVWDAEVTLAPVLIDRYGSKNEEWEVYEAEVSESEDEDLVMEWEDDHHYWHGQQADRWAKRMAEANAKGIDVKLVPEDSPTWEEREFYEPYVFRYEDDDGSKPDSAHYIYPYYQSNTGGIVLKRGASPVPRSSAPSPSSPRKRALDPSAKSDDQVRYSPRARLSPLSDNTAVDPSPITETLEDLFRSSLLGDSTESLVEPMKVDKGKGRMSAGDIEAMEREVELERQEMERAQQEEQLRAVEEMAVDPWALGLSQEEVDEDASVAQLGVAPHASLLMKGSMF